MCVTSFVGDYYADRWRWVPNSVPSPILPDMWGPITRAEFDDLKREVAEMLELMKAAKRIDELTGQPDCEMEDKITVLRQVAKLVGVDLADVLGESP